MQEVCELKVLVNGQHIFLLNQAIVSAFSGTLRQMIKQEKKSQLRDSGIKMNEFPGGPYGFELASRFCYNKGKIPITPSNISFLHCSAVFLEMTEQVSHNNLLRQTETFLEGLFYWTWNDILTAIKACESFLSSADSSGLLQKLISSLLVKISANSDALFAPSSSSAETNSAFGFSSAAAKVSSSKAWWFDDLTLLSPKTIESLLKTMGAYGTNNNTTTTFFLTRFLLHYLKTAVQKPTTAISRCECGHLADSAVKGVVLMGQSAFNCRGLFWVLRVVSGFALSKGCRGGLERLIGGMLDQASLDDLLVPGHDGAVYDVNLVLRLLREFVLQQDGGPAQKMMRVGKLIDKYMREISPDQCLKVSKFLAVAESLPDSARDCFDDVYRAIDIYLQSHPTLSFEERSRICGCLNYEKLTLESCKDLAKNPSIPPRIAIQALASQTESKSRERENPKVSEEGEVGRLGDEKEEMRVNLERMRWRVMELEKVCRQMKGQMSKMLPRTNKIINSSGSSNPAQFRASPRLC